jgi:WD40 repeat protein
MNLKGHERATFAAAFSPDGRWVATGSAGGAVRMWETATGQEVSTLSSKAPPISGVAFTRDSKKLLALEFDGLLRIFDVEGRRELSSYSVRMLGAAPSVALAVHPDGQRIATGGFDRLVTLSELDTGRQVLVLRELDSSCHCVTFSPDGNRLAAASASGKVYVWDATPLTGSEDPSAATYRHASREVWAVDISPHRLAVAAGGIRTGSPGGSSAPVLFWQGLEDRDPIRLPGYAIVVFSVAFDPTGRFIAAAGDEPLRPGKGDVKVWDLEAKREAFEVEAVDSEGRLLGVAFSPDGRRLVGGGNDRRVLVWDAATGRKIGTIGEHEGEIVAVTFSKNGKYLASSGYESIVKVWDGARLDERQPDPRRFRGLAAAIADVITFSPDEQRLAVIEDDDTVVLHDLEGTDRAVRLKSEGHEPTALTFHPSGRWVITGGKDCALKIWDSGSGALQSTLRSHTDHVTRLRTARFAAGSWLVSGSRDGTVKLWDLDSIERKLESR